MSGFVKVDSGIVNSSLWVERDHRSIFLTALFMAEPFELEEPTPQLEVRSLTPTGWVVPAGWYGFVRAAGTALVYRDGCDAEIGLAALEALGSPDPDSRSQQHGGRRLVRVNGGYIVLNYDLYRQRDYGSAERMRRMRARQKSDDVTDGVTDVTRHAVTDAVTDDVTDVTGVTRNDTQAEAEAEAEAEITTTPAPRARENSVRMKLVMQALGIDPLNGHSWDSWVSILEGMTQGLGTSGMKAADPDTLLCAAQELAAAGGEVTPLRFRVFVRKLMEPEQPAPTAGKRRSNYPNKTLEAAELRRRLRDARTIVTEGYGAGSRALMHGWKEKFTAEELRAIDAIGTERILDDDPKQQGFALAQLARVMEEL